MIHWITNKLIHLLAVLAEDNHISVVGNFIQTPFFWHMVSFFFGGPLRPLPEHLIREKLSRWEGERL